MASRTIKVGGTDQRIVLALGVLTGAGLAARGLSPTGSAIVDWPLLVLAATATVWASASAPWWALSTLAGIAAALAPPSAPLVIGASVFALSLAVGATMRSQPIERAAIAGAAMVVLSLARELGAWGINTLVAVAAVSVVAALGMLRRSKAQRRKATIAAAGIAAVAAVGTLGLFAAGVAARPDLSEGNRLARQGLAQLKSGEFETAQLSFERAAAAFERADRDLGAPWTQPARLVPIVSQHRQAGAELSPAAAKASETIHRQLREIDLEALHIVDGRIDIDAVRALQAPMNELQGALEQLDGAVDSADSGWLAGPVQRELDELRIEIDEQQVLGEKANAALEVAPRILGAEGERVYFVMFTTPAEARGSGGFMGNYAELTVDDGRIEMTAFGRHTDLNRAIEHPVRLEDAPEDWLAIYGPFGYQKGPDGVVGRTPWSNITMSPHFPNVATVVAELYPKSGGREIDGVLVLDVYAIEALVGLVGPLDVERAPEPLTGINTADFLLLDQYLLAETADRIDMLESVAKETLDRLLVTSPPDPIDLGRALAPMAQQRRLLAWFAGDEQQIAASAGMDGSLDPSESECDNHIFVSLVNAGASKIDSFLAFQWEPSTSRPDTATVRLSNTAPAEGMPAYVIGNSLGLPQGSSRLLVTTYSARGLDGLLVDEIPLPTSSNREAGLVAQSAYVVIPPEATVELQLNTPPHPQAATCGVRIETQSLALPAPER